MPYKISRENYTEKKTLAKTIPQKKIWWELYRKSKTWRKLYRKINSAIFFFFNIVEGVFEVADDYESAYEFWKFRKKQNGGCNMAAEQLFTLNPHKKLYKGGFGVTDQEFLDQSHCMPWLHSHKKKKKKLKCTDPT